MTEQTDRISFGLFELDLQAGELWKAGHKVRLPAQPFKVLTVLVGRPGEVITREELQMKVWGANTNVDFERAVAGAINKIREAVGDSAENPRFIQTLPKRGYRFIAPVTLVHPAASPEPSHQVMATHAQESLSHFPSTGPVREAEDLVTPSLALPRRTYEESGDVASKKHGRTIPLWIAISLSIGLACMAGGITWWSNVQPDLKPLKIEQITNRGAISTGPPNAENLLTLAADGNRILTSVMESGRPRLSAISLSTGEVQPLALPQQLSSSLLADISKDGLKLLLKGNLSSASEQPLWIVPASGGSALRVGNVLAHDASWMPDGTSILYANGSELAIIRLDNDLTTPFARLEGRAFWMRWSPNGKVLRFTLLDPVTHSFGIWQVDAEGGGLRRVPTPDPEHLSACCGTWTADGGSYILRVGDNLWSLRENGRNTKATQLTNGPLRFLSPVTAHSGSRIFFMGLNQPMGLQQFSEQNGFHPAPAFLANGDRVSYSRDNAWVAWTDNNEKLWRARAGDGSDKVQLTPGYLEVFMAHWSPDGKRLAVMARERGKVWRTYLISADGGEPEPLLREDRNAADPDWSADGKSLVFGREPDLMGKESGSHAIQLLDLATMKTEMVPGSEGLFSPRWSPDGRWIVALSLNQKTIFLYDVAQQRWRELAKTSVADPIWSADSKSVFIQAFLEDKQPILKISVPDGRVQNIADLSAFADRGTANYFFGGLTPKNQPLVQPKIGTGDLYTLDLAVR